MLTKQQEYHALIVPSGAVRRAIGLKKELRHCVPSFLQGKESEFLLLAEQKVHITSGGGNHFPNMQVAVIGVD